ASRGAASAGAASGGAEPGGAGSEGAGSGVAELGGEEPRGAEPKGMAHGDTESEGAESGGAEPRGATSPGGAGDTGAGGAGVIARAGGTGGTVASGPGGARTRGAGAAGTGGVGGAGAGDPTELGAAGAGGSCAGGAGVGGARAGGAGVGGTGAGGAGAGGAGAVDRRAGGAGGPVRPRPYFVPLLQQVLGVPSSTSLTPPLLCPPRDQSEPPLQPASPLPAPSPYTEQSGGLTEHREPASCPVSPVRTTCRVPSSRPPPVPGTHATALYPSSVPTRVSLPAPPKSSLPEVPDPESDRARVASTTVSRLLATAVNDPSFESAAASALVAELLDFAAAFCLDYATALDAESASFCPPSVGGECALGTDVLENRQEEFECFAAALPHLVSTLLAPKGDPDAPDIPTPRSYAETIEGPYSSQWKTAMDTEMASLKSTGTYVDEVPPPGANIVSGMWIFRVQRPLGSPPAFKARYVARGFSQRRLDYFQTFSLTPKMNTHQVLLHVCAQGDYELQSLDFSTAFLQGSLHEEIWLRCPAGFIESFPAGPSALRLLVLLATAHSSVYQPLVLSSTFGRVSGAECTSGMGLVLGGGGLVVLTGHADASWVDDPATQRSSQGYTFSLGCGFVSWRSTHSSLVLSSSCEAEIYAGAMAAQELRWLTYLLTDLGEQPRSPPVLYVDNKAMLGSDSVVT
ncbi:unnamed protein product, partial [Closterium sp. NIES-54]